MLVSIITPCFNCSKYISETMGSVLRQTYTEWEHIIVDDGSSDGSVNIVKQTAGSDPRVKLVLLDKNGGVANARNEGVKSAQGKFIAFLDSDDLWDENKLAKQVQFMVKNDYTFTHTSYRQIDSEGNTLVKKIGVSNKVDYNKLLQHNEIGCLTAMYDVTKLGKFYFPKIGHEDFAAWLQILKTGHASFGLDEVLASYRVHANTVSSNKLIAAGYTWHILRMEERIPLIRASYLFSIYVVKSLYKYLKK
ncbi:glycosyltransferase family 2 protein [Mucilaginibacter calamicampi]|uniref:Glycosyltransferase family 2 protein n=1 Tax=Mucilaginibacter calamicampi TaxID=1302352 RepID=A0ABW2YUB9_9SPHI